MRIQYVSDLHLECHPGDIAFHLSDAGADVVILAGDIGNCGTRYFDWVLTETAGKQAIMVAGNHEGYGSSWQHTVREWKAALNGTHVHFLDDRAVNIDGVRFLGGTLWTDYMIYGDRGKEEGIREGLRRMNDYREVGFEDDGQLRRLHPQDTIRMHRDTRQFLEAQLDAGFAGPTVVVTHHAPLLECVDEPYRSDVLTTAFAVDMSSLMQLYQPDIWVHGHLHNRVDKLVGRTRVLANARGYYPYALNPNFDPAACFEV